MAEKQKLTVASLCTEARDFARIESNHDDPRLFGVTDGKAVGTYFEHKFRARLRKKYTFVEGSSASGIDFPELDVDIKVTSIRQPQSSCPFKSARQKIFGLGYSLLVFVYDKQDNRKKKTGRLNILHTIFVDKSRTADYQTTTGLLQIVQNNGNADDIIAFMKDRFLPVDDVTATRIAEEILKKPPEVGYLTVSNALQWRLQYRRIIEHAGKVTGLERIV
ncbi:MAG: hypothetical protein MUO27_05760 [Sedimentisphaerales bacterium]|nr:hypothetical protein [Sedimentisphaerales bacterium]